MKGLEIGLRTFTKLPEQTKVIKLAFCFLLQTNLESNKTRNSFLLRLRLFWFQCDWQSHCNKYPPKYFYCSFFVCVCSFLFTHQFQGSKVTSLSIQVYFSVPSGHLGSLLAQALIEIHAAVCNRRRRHVLRWQVFWNQ